MSKAKQFLNEAEGVTEKAVLERVESMINDDKEFLLKQCKRLLSSGGIDPGKYGDDFRLPKILYYAALGDLMHQRQPLSSDMKAAKNLSHF